MFSVDQKRRRVLRLREPQLFGDLACLRFLNRADCSVSGSHREEAVEQFETLLLGGYLFELAGNEIVFGAAEQQGLALGHFNDHGRLSLREMSQATDDVVHCVGLVRAHMRIGMRDTTQDIGEGGQEPRANRFECFELAGDPSDCVCVSEVWRLGRRCLV